MPDRPVIYVEVTDGIAYVSTWGDPVEVFLVDWDMPFDAGGDAIADAEDVLKRLHLIPDPGVREAVDKHLTDWLDNANAMAGEQRDAADAEYYQ
jgi:hypothetical protein